jgi:hypothetical protein
VYFHDNHFSAFIGFRPAGKDVNWQQVVSASAHPSHGFDTRVFTFIQKLTKAAKFKASSILASKIYLHCICLVKHSLLDES